MMRPTVKKEAGQWFVYLGQQQIDGPLGTPEEAFVEAVYHTLHSEPTA